MTTAPLHLSSGWQCWIPLKFVLMRFLLPEKQNPPVRHWHWIYREDTCSACTQQDKCNLLSCLRGAHSSYVLMEWRRLWHKSQAVGTGCATRRISSPHDSVEQHFSEGTGFSKELKGRFYISLLGKMPKIKLSAWILEGWYLFRLQNHPAISRSHRVPKLDHKLAEMCACA